ncbi:MAG: SDR family oxidoreductase [Flavobacteriaceae bacterium]|jgi:UDP-2-acetamido-2,6-beta-L-arabino-hexul-4-ose reductase|nr:SDR family oxidoreductase [Flavobacteriaceae bacterium]
MINVGITGANGFIGWHLCRQLKHRSDQYNLVIFQRDWFDDNDKLNDFVKKCDTIIHLAGLNRHSEENLIYNTNIDLANKLINSLELTQFNGQIIFSSSIHEENDNIFGKSKKNARLLFSNWAKSSRGRFNGLIIPNVFGPFGKPFYNSVISTFCHQLINKETPKIDIDAKLNLIYIDDLIDYIINVINNKSNYTQIIHHKYEYQVSQILKILEKFKLTYLKNGTIPKFKNDIDLNLFNTFRSYIHLKTFFPVSYKNNIDERGNFVEIIRLKSGGQISFSSTKPNVVRGDHYHTRKIERFSVIKGEALIRLRKVGTNEILEYNLSGKDPSYVDMPVWYTHNIKNIGDDELYTVFWINEFYDPKNPDTYFENV